jgi:transcription initiation factor TFIIIB Brf1 subunit/transcription initiation factor TFIIB
MSHQDFSLFDKLLTTNVSSIQEETICNHDTIIIEQGMSLCSLCGLEVQKSIDINEMKHSIEPNRCFVRKIKDKTIYQDLQSLNISDHIKDIANDIYVETCKGKVHRGARRKAIVFASVFHAYKLDNNPQSCESLIKIFQMKRKDALKGLKFVNENSSKDSPIRSLYITPEHLIKEFLYNFHVSEEKRDEIIDMYNQIKDKSVILNRSRPQSVASGVIWYWICLNKKQINIKEFIKKVDLSELTVSKMAKEIARLNGHEEIIY